MYPPTVCLRICTDLISRRWAKSLPRWDTTGLSKSLGPGEFSGDLLQDLSVHQPKHDGELFRTLELVFRTVRMF